MSFEFRVSGGEEPDACADVAVGELGYWPVGSVFCIFFGPLRPVSSGVEPRAYSPVNILGRVLGDAKKFRGVRSGAAVRLARLESRAA